MRDRAASFRETSIEAVRAYWDARPCNLRHSSKPLGERAYFDEVEARKYFVEPHIPPFADFPSWKGRRVLEIGCGIGTDTISFARAGADVTAVDLSPRSLEIAAQRGRLFGLEDRVRFVRANVEELARAVPPEPYDLVYAFGVLHHTPRPEAALRELRPYVGPEGTLKLMVYHRVSWKVLGILLSSGPGAWRAPDRAVARRSEAQTGCPVTYTYTRGGFRRLLEASGYRVDELFVDHIFPWQVADYVRYRYRRAWPFRVMPRPLFRWLERCFGWHLCVTARVLDAAVGRTD